MPSLPPPPLVPPTEPETAATQIGTKDVDLEILDHAQCVVRPALPVLDQLAQHVHDALGQGSASYGHGGIVFPTGCVSRLVQAIEETHRRCHVRDQRATPTTASMAVVEAAVGAERRFLDTLAASRLALLEIRSTHPFERIEQIYRLFPESRIVVAVRNRTEVGGYARGLAEWLDTAVGRVTAKRAVTSPRIIVVGYEMLQSWSPPAACIVILPGADLEPAAAHRAVSRCRHCERVFAFANTVHAFNRTALTTAFGEVAFAPGADGAGTQVFIVKSPPVPMPKTTTMVAFKRAAFWRNKPRLRLAAEIAEAAYTNNTAKLQEYGLRFDQTELATPQGGLRVAILVENQDQGNRLQKLLPDWPVLSQATVATEMPRAESEGRAIVTITVAARVTVTADVLVRVTGGWGEIQMKEFPPLIVSNRAWEAIIIDFADEWHPRARRYARLRQRDYQRMGYVVAQVTHC